MKQTFALFFVLLSCVCSFAQMAPTPAQHKKLMEHRAKIVKLNSEVTRLQAELSFEISQLQIEGARIVVENRWPANTQFSAETFMFLQPSPPPASVMQAQSLSQMQAQSSAQHAPAPQGPVSTQMQPSDKK